MMRLDRIIAQQAEIVERGGGRLGMAAAEIRHRGVASATIAARRGRYSEWCVAGSQWLV